MKRILAGTVLMVMALPCYGAGENIPTSRAYVDSALSLKQAKFPAANSGLGSGTSVLTYTSTSGTIGERALYTDASSYDASNDADKLITASALNGAVTSLPTETTTKLVCANPGTCDLWNIVDQTAYARGSSSGGGSGYDLSLLTDINTVCFKSFYTDYWDEQGSCSEAVYNSLNASDWAIKYDVDGESVYAIGITVCSEVEPMDWGGQATSAQKAQLDAEHANQMSFFTDPEDDEAGHEAFTNHRSYCWCRLTTPNASNWVPVNSYSGHAGCSDCAYDCTDRLESGQLNSVFGNALL